MPVIPIHVIIADCFSMAVISVSNYSMDRSFLNGNFIHRSFSESFVLDNGHFCYRNLSELGYLKILNVRVKLRIGELF